MAHGFLVFDRSTGAVSHLERTVPDPVATQINFAAFGFIDFLPVVLKGVTYQLPSHILGKITSDMSAWHLGSAFLRSNAGSGDGGVRNRRTAGNLSLCRFCVAFQHLALAGRALPQIVQTRETGLSREKGYASAAAFSHRRMSLNEMW